MTVHTDTNKLLGYNSNSYPNIDGGVPKFITGELQKIHNAIASINAVLRLMETRMNNAGLA